MGGKKVGACESMTTYNSIKFLDAACGFFHAAHFDETETTRAVRLWGSWLRVCTWLRGGRSYPLVVNNGDLFDTPKPAKLFFEVALLSANAKPKHAKDMCWVGVLRTGGFIGVCTCVITIILRWRGTYNRSMVRFSRGR